MHLNFLISMAPSNPTVSDVQRVTIRNRHGENLVGILHETCSKELVIVCHGHRSSKDRIPMSTIAASVQTAGISAFRFDFAGNGESDGSYQYGNYRREAEDLRAVIEYFCRKQRMIAAIVGHSKGGNVALLYASKYNDIPMVVNLSARFNLNRSLEYHLGNNFLYRIRQDGFIDVMTKRGTYRVTEESLLDRITTDTRATSQLIHEDCRVLSVHGSKDELVPQEDALEFAKIIRNHKLHIVEGADHEYTRHQSELVSVVLGFISEGLKQGRDQPLHFTSKI